MGTTTTLFNGKLWGFFMQHLFYHFSPLNHLFFNIAEHLIRSQAWKNNCQRSMICILCLDQQREINNKLVHRGFRSLFQLVTYWVLGECRCIAVQPKVSFWYFATFFSVYRAELCRFAEKVLASIFERKVANWCRIMVIFVTVTIDLIPTQYQILH